MPVPRVPLRAAPGSCSVQACPSLLPLPRIWVHIPFGKGELPRSTIQGLDPWIWASGNGQRLGQEPQESQRSFPRGGPGPASLPRSRPPPSWPPLPCPPLCPHILAPSLLFILKPLFCTCHLCEVCLLMPHACSISTRLSVPPPGPFPRTVESGA